MTTSTPSTSAFLRLGLLLGAASSIALGGCATMRPVQAPPGNGQASWHSVSPPGTRHYRLALGEVASGSALQQEVAPVYPAAMLLSCPPEVEITALVIVDASGAVSDVRIDPASAADQRHAPFNHAIEVAAKQWRYAPLVISHWAADASDDPHVVDRTAKPFSLTYVFDFSCRGGRGSTSTQQAAASTH